MATIAVANTDSHTLGDPDRPNSSPPPTTTPAYTIRTKPTIATAVSSRSPPTNKAVVKKP